MTIRDRAGRPVSGKYCVSQKQYRKGDCFPRVFQHVHMGVKNKLCCLRARVAGTLNLTILALPSHPYI